MRGRENSGLSKRYESAEDLLDDVENMYDGDWEAAYTFLSDKHAELEEVWYEQDVDTLASLKYAADNGPIDNFFTAAGLIDVGLLSEEVAGYLAGEAYSGNTFYQDAVNVLADNAVNTADGAAVIGFAVTPALVYFGVKGTMDRWETYFHLSDQVDVYRSAKEHIKSEELDTGKPG